MNVIFVITIMKVCNNLFTSHPNFTRRLTGGQTWLTQWRRYVYICCFCCLFVCLFDSSSWLSSSLHPILDGWNKRPSWMVIYCKRIVCLRHSCWLFYHCPLYSPGVRERPRCTCSRAEDFPACQRTWLPWDGTATRLNPLAGMVRWQLNS